MEGVRTLEGLRLNRLDAHGCSCSVNVLTDERESIRGGD